MSYLFLDEEPDGGGEGSEKSIQVSTSLKVIAIPKQLGLDVSTPLKMLKQCREIGFEAGFVHVGKIRIFAISGDCG